MAIYDYQPKQELKVNIFKPSFLFFFTDFCTKKMGRLKPCPCIAMHNLLRHSRCLLKANQNALYCTTEWNGMQQNNMPSASFSPRLKCRNEMASTSAGGLTTLAICIILIPFAGLEASRTVEHGS